MQGLSYWNNIKTKTCLPHKTVPFPQVLMAYDIVLYIVSVLQFVYNIFSINKKFTKQPNDIV